MGGVRETGLDGAVAVVTGASRGLGAALARRFAADGARVVVAARTADALGSVVQSIEDAGGTALAQICDVTSNDAVDDLVAATLDRFGRVDVLVNNAGALEIVEFLDETDEQWDRMLEVNLTSARRVTKAVLPSMLDAGSGRIVFVSSNAAKKGFANDAGYSAAKAGLMALTKVLAVEFGKRGIDVHCVLPGFIDETEVGEQVITDHVERFAGSREAFYEWANPLSPKGFHPSLAAITELITFLASGRGQVLHGQCLTADYGLTDY